MEDTNVEILTHEDGTPVTGVEQKDGSYVLSDGSTAPSEEQVAAAMAEDINNTEEAEVDTEDAETIAAESAVEDEA